jgi:hypothetical protein
LVQAKAVAAEIWPRNLLLESISSPYSFCS